MNKLIKNKKKMKEKMMMIANASNVVTKLTFKQIMKVVVDVL